ncbi:MAG: DUF4907 domain-containing protein [Chitinophagaceae bacterium]|jgi:hypothetical protein
MKKTLLYFLFAISINVQAQSLVVATNTNEVNKIQQLASDKEIIYSIQTFKTKSATWGYDIIANGKVYFHQSEMPGKDNGLGFASEAGALKVGRRIVELLRSPVSVPSLTAGELQKMGIR